MIRNTLYSILVLTIGINISAQVGIGTYEPNPNVALDIADNLNISDRIYIGDEDLNAPGNDGEDKEIIVSSGPTQAPSWEKKQIPSGFGNTFTMTYMNSYFDNVGVNLTSVNTDPYNMDQVLNSNWQVLSNLDNEFTLYKEDNKVNFIFQSTGQITVNGASSSSASFACGLFLNSPDDPNTYRLKGVRTDAVRGTNGSNKIINMNITLENLPLKAGVYGTVYKARVACFGRNVQAAGFAIGKAINTTYLNQDMAQSSLSIYVLESQ